MGWIIKENGLKCKKRIELGWGEWSGSGCGRTQEEEHNAVATKPRNVVHWPPPLDRVSFSLFRSTSFLSLSYFLLSHAVNAQLPEKRSSPSNSLTVSRTLLLYSRLLSLYIRAASEFAGEFGLGSQSNDWIEVRIAATSYRTPPILQYIQANASISINVGWNIRETNRTVGGLGQRMGDWCWKEERWRLLAWLVDFEAWLGGSKLVLFIAGVILNWLESYLLLISLESVILHFPISKLYWLWC